LILVQLQVQHQVWELLLLLLELWQVWALLLLKELR